MREFNYLTFDCYGTLIDWKTGIEESLARAFGELPLKGDALMDIFVRTENEEEGSYKKYREVLRNTAMRLSDRLGVKLREGGADEFAGSVPRWSAFEDSASVLKKLGRLGYKRFILSNVDTDLLEGSIRRNGLEVDGFVTAEEVRSYKPSYGHWSRFMQKTGAEKKEILHVGQSVFHDMVPAERLGLKTAWVNRYRNPFPKGIEPLFVCDSLESLETLLSQVR